MLSDCCKISKASTAAKILIRMDERITLQFPFELSFQNTFVNCSFLFFSENRKIKPAVF